LDRDFLVFLGIGDSDLLLLRDAALFRCLIVLDRRNIARLLLLGLDRFNVTFLLGSQLRDLLFLGQFRFRLGLRNLQTGNGLFLRLLRNRGFSMLVGFIDRFKRGVRLFRDQLQTLSVEVVVRVEGPRR